MDIEAVTVVGGGLAGCSAALELAKRGIQVKLFEMRPQHSTLAHITDKLAELVCSNSLGSNRKTRALGLLKEELRMLDCEILKIAEDCAVPAGTALTVDRERFASQVTDTIKKHPLIQVIREEVLTIPQGTAILASGPLTSSALAKAIAGFCGTEYLYFYDAIAPIVSRASLDLSILVKAARYDAGEAGFLNAFMEKDEYMEFYRQLVNAEQHELNEADKDRSYFEGCLPVEEIARRGERSLAYGPLRPTGFKNAQGRRPFVVIQLRPENKEHTMYNLVGFQTNLRNKEQERVFRMIPGLKTAEFLRYGRMHRNTYIQAPNLIHPTLQFRNRANLFVAGQLSGAEGYLCAFATGLVAGMNAARVCAAKSPIVLPYQTMLGALLVRMAGYGEFASLNPRYSPIKPMLALLPTLNDAPRSKDLRREAYAERSIASLKLFLENL